MTGQSRGALSDGKTPPSMHNTINCNYSAIKLYMTAMLELAQDAPLLARVELPQPTGRADSALASITSLLQHRVVLFDPRSVPQLV